MYSTEPSARIRGARATRWLAVAAALALAGCVGEGITVEPVGETPQDAYKRTGGVMVSDRDRLTLFDQRPGGDDGGKGAKIGVNALLWRASLDTVSFMPLASADPFGGVIITDWYSDANTPDERFKVTVYILDQRLRADAVRVSLFRQARRGGGWADAAASPSAARQLEDQILTRAQQMRIAQTGGG